MRFRRNGSVWFAAFLLCAARAPAVMAGVDPVGFWESKKTSRGGIGNALEFRADGTVVEATTVLVEMAYRLIGDRLVTAMEPPDADADTSKAPTIHFEGDSLVMVGPDGSTVRKDRVSGKGASILGDWRYCHYAGAVAYERYAEDGRLLFRLPMRSTAGSYAVTGGELTIRMPEKPDATWTVEVRGDELLLSTGGGPATEYRREKTGAWYDPAHPEKCSPARPSRP